ncbi:unnamed protein product [Pleuronectes platessa]|uniref:Uncharacterized protein n=1 Tax=Pleuronectes platessa TaxID=8262 RepID=A0A9N7U5A6_PLEPL|nr:unnamed protein product [Pleuronectes platessa]
MKGFGCGGESRVIISLTEQAHLRLALGSSMNLKSSAPLQISQSFVAGGPAACGSNETSGIAVVSLLHGMMAKSREHVESFLEELREQLTAGVTSPGATTEACMSQQHRPIPENVTLEEQKRVLFHTGQEVTSQSKDSVYHILTQEEKELSADLEQRHNSSNIKQLEDKINTSQHENQLGDHSKEKTTDLSTDGRD